MEHMLRRQPIRPGASAENVRREVAQWVSTEDGTATVDQRAAGPGAGVDVLMDQAILGADPSKLLGTAATQGLEELLFRETGSQFN